MAIPNMTQKVSADDLEKMRNRHNDSGDNSFYSEDDEDMDFDGGFSNFDDSGSGSDNSAMNSPFGSEPSSNNQQFGSSSFGAPPAGGNQTFGSSPFGSSPFGSPTGGAFGGGAFGQQPPAQQQEQKPDYLEKAIDYSLAGFKELGQLIKEVFNTFKLRTVDDWALMSTHNIIVAGILIAIGLLAWVIGIPYGANILKFWRLPAMLISIGLFTGSTGLIGIGVSTIYALRVRGLVEYSIDNLDNLPTEMNTTQEEYEEKSSALIDELYDKDCIDDKDLFGEEDYDDVFSDQDEEEPEEPDEPVEINLSKAEPIQNLSQSLGNTPSLTREVLLNTLLPLFPNITPDFNTKETVDPDSDEFLSVESLAIKALANASNKEEEQIMSGLEELVKNSYSFELKIKRIKGMNKLVDIEREIVAYFRSGVSDNSVQCTADIDGDFYKIIISFGNDNIVGIRDVLGLPGAYEFFKNRDHALPFISCIDELGEPVILDAKKMDTMLIAGKPRSGKSWYLLSTILSFVTFNPPEEVQFLIIDPKESNLFKEVALLPHVCGLHNDSNVIDILNDVINGEGARRKKLLSDNRCENVWDLRKKGITIPIIYIVIDEVMTIKSHLGERFKEFLSVISTIVTQLPSQGIRLMLVPHRSKGVIEPAIRVNISYTSAICAEVEIVKETLDIPKWTRKLLKPGELAIKANGLPKELYGRSVAVTSSDFDNSELIRELARCFYKMGVELPDMSGLGKAYNQDIKAVQEELSLSGTGNRVQFSTDDLQKADIEIDLNKY